MNDTLVRSGLAAVGATLLLATTVQAAPVELGVLPLLDAPQTARCPEKVRVSEQLRPYREGGYTIDGSASLGSLAEKFSLGTIDSFSVTWVAQLKAPYNTCQASGGITRKDGEEFQGHSYLRLRFTGGKVYLILDMTGMRDINGYTSVIINKGVRNGNPFWSWGGTD